MAEPVVIPLLLDTDRGIAKVKCPFCFKIHFYQPSDWQTVRSDALRFFCKSNINNHLKILQLKLADGPDRTPVCPTGSIPYIPDPNCSECHGSGEYVGLQTVEPCSRCTRSG